MWVPHSFGAIRRPRVLRLVYGVIRLFLDDRFKRRTLCFHPNMTVMAEHALRDMAGDVHDGLIARTTFRKIRDERVPVVVPASRDLAFSRRFCQAVFRVVTGRVGSFGRGFPKGNTYHSGRISPKRSVYHSA